mgnify:CR=1 FL=1
MPPFRTRLLISMLLLACSARAFSPAGPLLGDRVHMRRATSSACSELCMEAAGSGQRTRRTVIQQGFALVPALAVVAGRVGEAAAQRPPPRPKTSSIPDECKQAGGCGMKGEDTGLADFRAASALRSPVQARRL